MLLVVNMIPNSSVTQEQVEQTLNAAEDWIRYQDYCWFVRPANAQQNTFFWRQQLNGFVNNGGQVLVFMFSSESFFGFMSDAVRDWLGQYIVLLPG